MTKPTGPTQGFIAVSWSGRPGATPDLRAVLAAVSADAPTLTEHATIRTATWGLDVHGFDRSQPLLLCRNARRRERELDLPTSAGCWPAPTATGSRRCSRRLPPSTTSTRTRSWRPPTRSASGTSTTARATASRCCQRPPAPWAHAWATDLDREAIALQSLLGWQVGQRTLFGGVHKLGPGELATLGGGRISSQLVPPAPRAGQRRPRRVRRRGGDDAARLPRRLPRRPSRRHPATHRGPGLATSAERGTAGQAAWPAQPHPRSSRQPGQRDRRRPVATLRPGARDAPPRRPRDVVPRRGGPSLRSKPPGGSSAWRTRSPTPP